MHRHGDYCDGLKILTTAYAVIALGNQCTYIFSVQPSAKWVVIRAVKI